VHLSRSSKLFLLLQSTTLVGYSAHDTPAVPRNSVGRIGTPASPRSGSHSPVLVSPVRTTTSVAVPKRTAKAEQQPCCSRTVPRTRAPNSGHLFIADHVMDGHFALEVAERSSPLHGYSPFSSAAADIAAPRPPYQTTATVYKVHVRVKIAVCGTAAKARAPNRNYSPVMHGSTAGYEACPLPFVKASNLGSILPS